MPPLIGREREWHLMQQWMGEEIGSTVLLLLGEPGIGKTRLLEELREAVQTSGGTVIWGQGFEAEMIRPYGAWIDALRSLARDTTVNFPPELGFLLPEVSQPVETLSDRSRLFDAVVQFLSQLCHRKSPVLIVLDDIQWLDEASIALLHYAIRLLRYSLIRFAWAARSKEVEENESVARVIQTLRREQRLQTVEVNALDREQTTELIQCVSSESQLTSFSEQTADQIFIDSGGNPLFTLEVARTLSQSGNQSGNQSEKTSAMNPDLNNLELLIRDRLQRLDDSVRALLPWAAALGRSFDLTTVAYVADCPPVQLLAAVEQLEQRSIIRPSLSMNPLRNSSIQSSGTLLSNEVCYNFSHDIVRQIAYRQLSEPRRRLIHLQIANKLEQRSAQDSALSIEIAHHAAL
ncbi:MAG TPA: AAA family ATPase, partial [Allocoleopsis sp.]